MSHQHIYIYNIYIIPFLFRFGCFTPQTYVFAGERNPVHHTLLDQRPEGGRGKGDDNGPSQRTFHNQPIPAGHFRVSLTSVKSGHEDLPPPVQHVGADDKTPPRIGSCKNWVLLWPKNLIRLEPAESTPITTTHQQACAETTSPPTQLPAPVVPGECGG